MAYTLSTLLTEFYSRGFAYLNDGGAGATRATRYVNDALHEIDRMERWDYRRASTTGAAPLTISDLGEVESVKDSNSNTLVRGDRGVLQAQYDDLTTTGTASFYYTVAGVLNVFPVSTLVLTVFYYKNGPDLSSGGDAPLMPDQFRSAIVERACRKAYLDQDDPQMASVCLDESDRLVQQMREYYVLQPGPARQTVVGHSSDW